MSNFEIHLDTDGLIHKDEVYRQLEYLFNNSDNLETCLVDYCNIVCSVISSIIADESISNKDQVLYNLDKQLIPVIKQRIEKLKGREDE